MNNTSHSPSLLTGGGSGGGSVLSTTYFGPVQWYSKLFHCAGQCVDIEACESFVKQTYRNRCVIATANGQQALSIPVAHGAGNTIKDIEISDHGNWRHLHWQAIKTAYGESAFFEYYEDDFRPFYEDCGPTSPVRMKYLLDYNMAGTELMCRLLDLDVRFRLTDGFVPPVGDGNDFRYSISPKTLDTEGYTPKPYYQVYRERHGFIPNLSILDLLFNEGPQAILKL